VLIVSRLGVHGVAERRADRSPQRSLLINLLAWGQADGRW
jgi:hypothetical protein